jgi:hypothetical protein
MAAMDNYALSSIPREPPAPFSALPDRRQQTLTGDCRRDRVRRFITLIFMDNDREICLQQQGDDLLIRRHYDEAYAEG